MVSLHHLDVVEPIFPNMTRLSQMQNLKDEIQEKKRPMQVLERRMIGSIESSPNTTNI
jgi:hypothetical protein